MVDTEEKLVFITEPSHRQVAIMPFPSMNLLKSNETKETLLSARSCNVAIEHVFPFIDWLLVQKGARKPAIYDSLVLQSLVSSIKSSINMEQSLRLLDARIE